MSKGRRGLLAITLALVAGGLVVWSFLPPGGRMSVTVVFIGYTNAAITPYCTFVGSAVTSTIPLGVFMATNTGSVPVKLFSDARFDTSTNTDNFAQLLYVGSTGPLRPGDAAIVQALVVVRTGRGGPNWPTAIMVW